MTKNKLYGVLFVILGIVSLWCTKINFQKTLSFQRSEVRVVGTVYSVETKLVGGKTKTLVSIPTISFTTTSGKYIMFISDIDLNPYSVKAGDSIAIAYDPNDPFVAHIDTPNNSALWEDVITLGVISLLLFFVSWVCFMGDSVARKNKLYDQLAKSKIN
jgi:hypothetical protein